MLGKHADFRERQKRAPLYEQLERHVKRRPHPFHVPGHKMGHSFDREGKHRFQSILEIDLTEINGTDDLHQPEGVIAEAQQLAAEAFGAEETRFLIGGSTVGNLALIMTVCRPGDKILVQRNCHKSVYHGIIMARATPIFLVPAVDLATGVAAGVRREDVERALQAHPDAKAVFLTNPTYYGMGIDLEKMAATVHRHGIPLLIDEAHGPHFGFHPAFPLSAMQSGADAAVQSTHKMASAMTMSSMLHLQGERIDRERLFRYLAMIQSSSPSYVLMASLDLARRHLVQEAQEEWERLLPQLDKLRERTGRLEWLEWPKLDASSVYATLDPLKLFLHVRTEQMDGFALQHILERHGIFAELADSSHVLLAASAGTCARDLDSFARLLESLDVEVEPGAERILEAGVVSSHYLREQVVPMDEAVDLPKESIPLDHSLGRVVAEMVIPYPPGIPVLVPGERVDAQGLAMLLELRKGQTRFHGVQDDQLQTIQVLR
ncbi:aminotransferase class I/II-fold pyridoxal phosphate-dependent enzyme [Brevibacillus nitrificans]|uniref:Aminotransferase class I/II-fold pyridoxal phosphate-dependent enzyme n=1 Tax=Brevibacillus nitrificans TaxID=651560 RepID=A0A3M8DDW2_9BACL|nr:aminotransferase class I/II-fold pyridoxal phosphate-dependent enzyme [Brevibacillus nitrificans]RNB85761.1 aminotransferase class I/II-fold pyridoxal phosphate-dependent enzyme [Brevibacillus nitrificans]